MGAKDLMKPTRRVWMTWLQQAVLGLGMDVHGSSTTCAVIMSMRSKGLCFKAEYLTARQACIEYLPKCQIWKPNVLMNHCAIHATSFLLTLKEVHVYCGPGLLLAFTFASQS